MVPTCFNLAIWAPRNPVAGKIATTIQPNKMETNKKYNPDLKVIIDDLLLDIPGVSEGHMFGHPAYYIRGKLLACHYHNGIALKVPEEVGEDLLHSNENEVEPFSPMGKNMGKNWILLKRSDLQNYHNDLNLFETAAEYVSSIAGQ